MLYITNIDSNSFATSSSHLTIEAAYPKLYYAFSVVAPGGEHNLITIKHKDDGSYLVSSRAVSDITLDGVIYTTKEGFVSAFNELMSTGEGEGNSSALELISIGLQKDHAEWGIHFLVGTDPAPTGRYYGFTPTEDGTAISSITYIDDSLHTGDTDFTTMPLVFGLYYPLAGLFSTVTLSAGSMQLFKAAPDADITTTEEETTTTLA